MKKMQALEYETSVRFREGQYLLQIKELNILTKSSDLNKAYQDLVLLKESKIKEYDENDLLESLPKPDSKSISERSTKEGYLSFFFKSMIISFIFFVSVVFSGILITDNLKGIVGQFNDFNHIKLGKKLEQVIIREGEREVSAERIERLTKSIQKIIVTYKPIAKEVLLLFKDEQGG